MDGIDRLRKVRQSLIHRALHHVDGFGGKGGVGEIAHGTTHTLKQLPPNRTSEAGFGSPTSMRLLQQAILAAFFPNFGTIASCRRCAAISESQPCAADRGGTVIHSPQLASAM